MDNRNYVVRNADRVQARYTGREDEFVTVNGKPVAFSRERALELAGAQEGIMVVPDDMVVILDDSARKLPRSSNASPQVYSESLRTQ